MPSVWRSRLVLSVSVFAIVMAVEPPLQAQATGPQINPALFQALHWRGIGPYRGGRALAVTGIPGDPYTFYHGAVAGGVWRTTDAGATWTPLSDHAPFWSVGAIAVAPSTATSSMSERRSGPAQHHLWRR
jgi:hypothetical protein